MSRAHISKSKRCFNVKSSSLVSNEDKDIVRFQICISAPLRKMRRRESYNFVTKLHFLRILLQIKKPPIQGILPFLCEKLWRK